MKTKPSGWREALLGDHIDIQTGFPFKSKIYTEDASGIRLLRGDNIVQGKLRWDGVKRWPDADSDGYQKYLVREGDIVLAMDRPWIEAGLKYAWITNRDLPCLLVQRVARLRGINGLLTAYIRYIIGHHSFTDYVKGIWTGVAVPHISESQIRAFRFLLPPPEKQERIAHVLGAYDDLIENNTRRMRILEKMAQMLYREWFVNFRFPGHEKGKMVESELGLIPRSFEVRQLIDVCAVYRGRSYRSEELSDTEGLPFVNLKCIARDGGFRTDGIKRYTGLYKPSQVATPGDIVMAVTDMTQERRIVARCGRVPNLSERLAVFSMDIVKLQPSADLPNDYLYSFLRFSSFADSVKEHANGANVLHLNPSLIEQYKFSMPPATIRMAFSGIVAAMYQLADVLETKSANLRRTRDLLLPKLVSGEVSVEKLETEATAQTL